MINEGTKEKYLNKYYGKLYAKDIYKKDGINFCICNCECGNENYHVRASDLRKAISCGCVKSGNGKIRLDKNRQKLVNKVYNTNNYGTYRIIDYHDKSHVRIKFTATGFETIVTVSQIYSGEIKDPYMPLGYGQYIGVGVYKTHDCNQKSTFEYKKWRWMLLRCYNPNELEKEPSYIGCNVCNEWMNFQNFAQWIQDNKYQCDNLELDKDLLILGNKLYSPDTCCLLPHEINFAVSNCTSIERHKILFNKYKSILPKHIINAYEEFITSLGENR